MKALIKIVSAADEFSYDQIQFIKRMGFCLQEHHKLSVQITIKEKRVKNLKIKRA
jgi:hypothetical protein